MGKHVLQRRIPAGHGDQRDTSDRCCVSPRDSAKKHRKANDAPADDARLHDAIEAISEAFVLWDADNRLVMCNSKYKQFYNLADNAAVSPGTPYEEVIADRGRARRTHQGHHERQQVLGRAHL